MVTTLRVIAALVLAEISAAVAPPVPEVEVEAPHAFDPWAAALEEAELNGEHIITTETPSVLIVCDFESSAPQVMYVYDRARPEDRERLVKWMAASPMYDVVRRALVLAGHVDDED